MTEERLAALEARVAALEARLAGSETPAPAAQLLALPDDSLIAALRLRAGPAYEQGDTGGAVTYAGAVRVPSGEYVWHIERPVPGLLGVNTEQLAQVFAALGSERRLMLVRALLDGPRTSQQLQEVLGVASAGQLYHHLKELLAAGIIEQRARSDYRLAPQKIVPFLTAVAVAYDLGTNSGEWPGRTDE